MSNYATAIGLDVHARSIKACALNPMTGEVERASFGYDPVSVAEWVLGFEEPRAVYESGVTGFHLCRALRALGVDCVVGAVSKMIPSMYFSPIAQTNRPRVRKRTFTNRANGPSPLPASRRPSSPAAGPSACTTCP